MGFLATLVAGCQIRQPARFALQEEIALIPDEVWQAGPKAVAAAIAEIELRHHQLEPGSTPLALAALADFEFDSVRQWMEMVGFKDDTAHLKDPALVQDFLDDIEEVQDGLQDFLDYSDAARNGANSIAVLSVATDKILSAIRRTKDKTHIRARRVVELSADLLAFSNERRKRDELGKGLCLKLDMTIKRLRDVCRKHLAPAFLRLEPLQKLELGDADPAVITADLKAAIESVLALSDGTSLARMSPEGQAVLRSMLADLDVLQTTMRELPAGAQRDNARKRFTIGFASTSATFGRAIEKAKALGNDRARVRNYTPSHRPTFSVPGPIFM